MLGPAIQTIWSKEILFQAMPVLRFEQFAVKKTELGVMPGLQVNFMRYNNLPIPSGPLVDGMRMQTYGLSAQQYQITVAEHGFAVAVSELLLNASFDDVMASASRLLGRNMALYIDEQARTTLQRSSTSVYGYAPPTDLTTGYGIYNAGTKPATRRRRSPTSRPSSSRPHTIKDAVETLASKNVPRLGRDLRRFIHPHQSRRLRDTPEFIEVTKYAAPGNFMLGEIGRLYDVVFIETTQIDRTHRLHRYRAPSVARPPSRPTIASGRRAYWRSDFATPPTPGRRRTRTTVRVPWQRRAGARPGRPRRCRTIYDGLMLGDNAFGHAISLPVELRDGGVLDFGREHALAGTASGASARSRTQSVVRMSPTEVESPPGSHRGRFPAEGHQTRNRG